MADYGALLFCGLLLFLGIILVLLAAWGLITLGPRDPEPPENSLDDDDF